MPKQYKEIHQFENIYQAIYKECESNLYYPPENYQRIYQKILYAASTLYYSGVRIFHHQNILFTASDKCCTKESILELLTKIYCLITEINLPTTTEQKIQQLIEDYHLVSNELLIPYPSMEQEHFKIQTILNGIS